VSKVIESGRQAARSADSSLGGKKSVVSGRAGSRKEQKEDTRQKVRAAALELFSSRGFAETSTKEIAERAGVAGGTVFVHAPDKEDLLCLVMHDLLSQTIVNAFESLPKVPLDEQVLHVFGELFKMYALHPKLAQPFVAVSAAARSHGPNAMAVGQLTFELMGRFAALVTEAQATGVVEAEVPPLLLAQNLMALYFFSLMSWTSGYVSHEVAFDPQLTMAVRLSLRGAFTRG